jgi:hypothetical protein
VFLIFQTGWGVGGGELAAVPVMNYAPEQTKKTTRLHLICTRALPGMRGYGREDNWAGGRNSGNR